MTTCELLGAKMLMVFVPVAAMSPETNVAPNAIWLIEDTPAGSCEPPPIPT
jgi:hypothetical protein